MQSAVLAYIKYWSIRRAEARAGNHYVCVQSQHEFIIFGQVSRIMWDYYGYRRAPQKSGWIPAKNLSATASLRFAF